MVLPKVDSLSCKLILALSHESLLILRLQSDHLAIVTNCRLVLSSLKGAGHVVLRLMYLVVWALPSL